MKITDRMQISGVRRREDGYLVADARVARTGVQEYLGREIGMPERDIVRVYRPGAEVFSDATLGSFAHRPVTVEHPREPVTAENWKQHAVGQTADEVGAEGRFIRVPLMVADAAAIKAIEDGKRELSAGYTCDLDWTAGETPEGEAYDAIQRNIRANHVAIVAAGRAGPECRIGDDAGATWGAAPIIDPPPKRRPSMSDKLRTVVVDGFSVETTDQGAQAIERLQKQLSDAETKRTESQKAHDAALAAKDGEIAKKDAEIADLKAKVLDDKALAARVEARAKLVSDARKVAPELKIDGLSDAEIRRAAVVAKLGEEAIKGRSEAYIDARFDVEVEAGGSKPDGLRDALRGGVKAQDDNPWGATVFDSAGVRMKKEAH